jgi:hypothetical protein
MTSQGTAHGRFTPAIRQRNLFQAELALREMGTPSLLVALDYLELLAVVRPDKFSVAAVRWHGRLELEVSTLTLAESQLALSALAALREGNRKQGTCSGGFAEGESDARSTDDLTSRRGEGHGVTIRGVAALGPLFNSNLNGANLSGATIGSDPV